MDDFAVFHINKFCLKDIILNSNCICIFDVAWESRSVYVLDNSIPNNTENHEAIAIGQCEITYY